MKRSGEVQSFIRTIFHDLSTVANQNFSDLSDIRAMETVNQKSTNPALDLFLIQLAGRYSNSKNYSAGESLFEEGERGVTMLLILSGNVDIFKQSRNDDTRLLIGRRGAGEFLGEMALVEELPRSATVIAQTPCEVLEFSKENFEKVIQEAPALATRVLQSLSNKLRESDIYRIQELEENNRILNATNEELIRLNIFLDCIIDRSPSAILLATRTGQIFRLNSAAVSMFGLEDGGENSIVDDFFSGFTLANFRKNSEDSWHGEVTAYRKGEEFPAFLSVASLTGHNQSVLHLLMCQDVSEMHEYHRTIGEFEKFASARQTAVELAHDLKNMLGILHGNVELVVSRLTEEQKTKSKRAINAIEQTMGETNQYVEGIMAYREERSDFKPVNFRTMTKAILRFCTMQGIFKDVSLEYSIDPKFPRTILVKDGQIQSVFINLLSNAAEALDELEDTSYKGIQVDLSVDSTGKWAIIKVLDNGPGIPQKHLSKVFKKSFTTKPDGHGIGLVSIAKIIESHDGEISVDSSSETGTTFTVKLPLDRTDGDA